MVCVTKRVRDVFRFTYAVGDAPMSFDLVDGFDLRHPALPYRREDDRIP